MRGDAYFEAQASWSTIPPLAARSMLGNAAAERRILPRRGPGAIKRLSFRGLESVPQITKQTALQADVSRTPLLSEPKVSVVQLGGGP